jgi:branched-chain amino acid transport system substrate-binding protein
MKLKRIALMLLVVALLVPTLAACGKSGGDTIKIGGLAPLTGDISVYGIAATNAAKLAFSEINKAGGVLGKPIEFIVLDEKGDVNEAVNAYNKLIDQEKVVAIFGDITSKPTISVAQLAAKANIPMITPTATALDVTRQGNNIFRACYIDPFQGEIMAQFAKEKLSVAKVAVIYNSGDDYSSGLMTSFANKAKELGLEVVATESYSKGDTDFKAQLTKIAASGGASPVRPRLLQHSCPDCQPGQGYRDDHPPDRRRRLGRHSGFCQAGRRRRILLLQPLFDRRYRPQGPDFPEEL